MQTSSRLCAWHYKHWQRETAGYLRTLLKNKALPNNEMIGYVINDKHPKSNGGLVEQSRDFFVQLNQNNGLTS